MLKTAFLSPLRDLIGLIYPPCCAGCHGILIAGEDTLCTGCLVGFRVIGESERLKDRLIHVPRLENAYALTDFRRGTMIRNLLHELKYNHQPEIGRKLGKHLGASVRIGYDLIIPVPLHKTRSRVRGYNQSERIAAGLSETTGIPLNDSVLIRPRRTKTQTRKSRHARWQNVCDAFQVTNPDILHHRKVLLVDDVITTGSTAEACARELLKYGCSGIAIACIAEVA